MIREQFNEADTTSAKQKGFKTEVLKPFKASSARS
jgi:hypothetical protein